MANKTIGLIVRHPNVDRSGFREYYEDHHAPLAAAHLGFSKYVRNHLIGEMEPGFDAIVEFYADDLGRTRALASGEKSQVLAEDMGKFADRPRTRSVTVTEILVAGPPRPTYEPARPRQAILLARADGVQVEAFAEAAVSFAKSLRNDPHERIVMDLLVERHRPAPPFDAPPADAVPLDAVLWFWRNAAIKPGILPPEFANRLDLAVLTCESPAEDLHPVGEHAG